jgi:tetratricopeptide (TPR) repeat protein
MANSAQGRLQRWAIIVCVLWATGCATYTDVLRTCHKAADRGDYKAGISTLSNILGVASYKQIPDEWTANKPLAALERAMLLQARGLYKWSARDLSAAEMELEFLDLKQDTIGSIGKYIYSDSARIYRAQPTERLALNALNMLNYLAMGNLQGASIEARRFTIARDYLESSMENDHQRNSGAFGSYVAGFVFEKLGEPGRALRYYEEALGAGDLQALREPILRLSAQGHYVGRELGAYLRQLEGSGSTVQSERSAGTDPKGEILIVLCLGRAPYKTPKRIPILTALEYAGGWVSGNPDILLHSPFKIVTYPEQVIPDNQITSATVNVSGQSLPVELLTDFEAGIAREYEMIKPTIIGAALTRMIARAVAAEGTRHLVGKEKKSVGELAALASEAALVALDRPDTRSWTFLPAHVFVSRAKVEPGLHEIRVELLGRARQTRIIQVEVSQGGYSVVVTTEPR